MISTFEKYRDIVDSYSIKRYRQFGRAHEFIAIVYFKDHSSLHIRDYIFLDGSRKYSFHWQGKDKCLIRRWDNAEHHKHLPTFPFHVHTPSGVILSAPMTLSKVLGHIQKHLQTNGNGEQS